MHDLNNEKKNKRFSRPVKPAKPHPLALPTDPAICVHLEIHDDGVKRCTNPAVIKGRHGWTCSSHVREVPTVKPPTGLQVMWEPEDAAALESMSVHSFLYYNRQRNRIDQFKARFLDKVDDAELVRMIDKGQGHTPQTTN